MIALQPETRRRLIASARLLESDKPGEALAAISAVHRLLPEGQTLAGVLEVALTCGTATKAVPVIPVPPRPAHWGQADCCLAVLDLTDWERGFLAAIRRKEKISDKQRAILAPLYAKGLEAARERR